MTVRWAWPLGCEPARIFADFPRALAVLPHVREASRRGLASCGDDALGLQPVRQRRGAARVFRQLEVRRSADGGADLWSTFNWVQEALVSGGLRGRSANGQRMRTRPVQGIDAKLKLNRALWMLAESMRQLKG